MSDLRLFSSPSSLSRKGGSGEKVPSSLLVLFPSLLPIIFITPSTSTSPCFSLSLSLSLSLVFFLSLFFFLSLPLFLSLSPFLPPSLPLSLPPSLPPSPSLPCCNQVLLEWEEGDGRKEWVNLSDSSKCQVVYVESKLLWAKRTLSDHQRRAVAWPSKVSSCLHSPTVC